MYLNTMPCAFIARHLHVLSKASACVYNSKLQLLYKISLLLTLKRYLFIVGPGMGSVGPIASCVKFRKYLNFAGMSENTFQSFNMEVYEKVFF